MGAVSSAVEGCFTTNEELSESGSHVVFRKTNGKILESPDDATILTKEASRVDEDQRGSNDSPRQRHYNLSLEDFKIIRCLGKGSFGKVYLVKKKATKKLYALKALKKKDLLHKNLLACTLREKNILKEVEHPFVVQLKYAFQSKMNAYMVMDYCPGGDLHEVLSRVKKFNEKTIKYCAAEIVLALEYLHDDLNIIHRDIKPDNILIAPNGHLKISDFGLAKASTKALTFCGTPEYLAPEVITVHAYGQEVDWWSLGCLIYQMAHGRLPFYHQSREKVVQIILTQEPLIPHSFSQPLRDLVTRLLDKNPKQRLGAKGAQEVKKHPFFKGIDWKAILNQKLPPPFKPIEITETPHHHKMLSNGSALEPQFLSMDDSDSFDFPQFSYAARDTIADESDLQIK